MKTRKINKKLKYSRKTFKGGMSQGPEAPGAEVPQGQVPVPEVSTGIKVSNVKKIQDAIFVSLNNLDDEHFNNITKPMIDAVKRLSKTPFIENEETDEDETPKTIEDEQNDFLQDLLEKTLLYASQIFYIEKFFKNNKLDKTFVPLNDDQFMLIQKLVNDKKEQHSVEFNNQLIKMLGTIEENRRTHAKDKTILRPKGRLITPKMSQTQVITSKPYNKNDLLPESNNVPNNPK
jgi:hypothetical protein